ncbi:MAG: hypothetical protein AB1716_20680 [Planctomycetota bacterium]
MAPHLGRHMATIHGTRPKTQRPGRPGRPMLRPMGGAPGNLVNEVQAWRSRLEAQRSQITAQVAALDQLLATLGR